MKDELDDIEALAAEYVLGTLEADERRRAEDLMARDRHFSALVDDWNRRLAPLAEAIPPVAPPPEVWQRIESALRARAAPQPESLAPRPAAPQAARPSGGLAGLWQQAAFWRWCSLGTAAAAAALALYVAIGPLPGPLPGAEPRYAAMLSESGAAPAWLIGLDPAAGQLEVRPLTEIAADVSVEDRAFELWLIADAEEPPRSLGLLDPAAQTLVPLEPVFAADPAGAVLAVSLEPPGGSPTGLPTGPVVYQGAIFALDP
ncbi:MAG: anti-sigma factor [Kiloniellales bacterium]|nr:anti-sigma factor [Kiloniellales bacterium]